MTPRAALFAGCALLFALFAAISHAAPEGDATIRTDTFTVPSGERGQGQVFCPAGTRLTGGGVTGSGVTNSRVEVSGPLDETGLSYKLENGDVGRSWYALVQNRSTAPQTFVTSAICSAQSDATLQVDRFFVNGQGSADGQAFCPPGTRVIGGGVTGEFPTGHSAIRVSGPLDETGLTNNLNSGDVGRSWYAYVAYDEIYTALFWSTAICSADSRATIAIDPFNLGINQATYGQAVCEPGTRVVGGGVTSTARTGEFVRVSGPLDVSGQPSELNDGDVGYSWFAYVYNEPNPPAMLGPNTMVSTAICAPSTTSSSATCKGKAATVFGSAGASVPTFKGTSKRDVIVGTSGKDRINAGKGNDLVCAGDGSDKVRGGGGKDRLFGQGGKDKLLGGGGNDTCVGGPGKDIEKSC